METKMYVHRWSRRARRAAEASLARTVDGLLPSRLAGHLPTAASAASAAAAVPPPIGAGRAAASSVAFLREAMALAAKSTSDGRWRIRRAVAAVLAAILSLSGIVALPAAAVVAGPGTLGGFEQDGNLVVDTPGNLDWANQPDAVVVIDDTLDSGFRGSSKEQEPADWVCQNNRDGVDPPKDDILRAYVNPRISTTGAYLDLAFVRKDGEGDTHINFEFNQQGEVTPYAPGACPIPRRVGDLLITYDFGGTNDPVATVRAWRWAGTAWVETAAQTLVAMAANNAVPITDPLAGGEAVEYRAFGEITIDLHTIPGLPLTCPGLGYVNVRSRSSGESFTSALQDKLPTAEVDLNTCGTVKLNKVDDQGATLAGATFGLYPSPDASGQPIAQCTTDATGSCTFTEVAPGTYSVKEIAAPAGHTPDPTVAVVTVGIRQDAVIPRAFVNPLILGGLTVVKTDSANRAAVAGVQFRLLQNGVFAKTRSGADAECTTGTNGECTIGGLVPGTYTLREVASTVPPSMNPVPDRTVTVAGGVTPLRVSVVNPVKGLAIALAKLVNGAEAVTVHQGDLLTYTLAVTNTGELPIDITSLTDNNGAPVALPATCVALVQASTFIAPGATVPACTYTATAGRDDIINTATVVGTDVFGRTATARDTAKVTVISPAVTLVKTVNGRDSVTVAEGDPLTYRLVITNTGDTPLTVTSLTDTANGAAVSLPPACTVTSLAVGASHSCTYSGTAPAGGVVNTAVVEATDLLGGIKGTVRAEDTAAAVVLHPVIALEKTVNGAETATVHQGDTVTYRLTITNTGDAPLTVTSLTDVVGTTPVTLSPECLALIGRTLGTSSPLSCSYQLQVGASNRVNTARVGAVEPVTNTPVVAQDTATVFVARPAIDIVKTVDKPLAHAGDLLTYSLVITNTGNIALTGTSLVDVVNGVAPGNDLLALCRLTTLEPAQRLTCTYTAAAGAVDITNLATVVAVDGIGGDKGRVTDSDDAVVNVLNPAIRIVKTASPTSVHAGDTVTFTLRITNTGDADLTITALNDALDQGPPRDMLDRCQLRGAGAQLSVGESVDCTYTVVAGTTDMTNIARVDALDVLDRRVSGTDDAVVEVVNPRIEIVKTAEPPVARTNQLVTYTLVITNRGDGPLVVRSLLDVANNQVVSLSPACLALVGTTIAANGSSTCTYTVPAGTADITNVATVVGRDVLGRDVNDDDDAVVEVVNPAIVVDKTADRTQVHPGDTVTYRVVITNTGDTPLTLSSLTDAVNQGVPTDILGTCNLTGATVLQPGQSTPACTYRVTAGTADLLNVVVVRATDLLGGTVTDDDNAFVEVLNPAIRIEKSADRTQAHPADVITYTLVLVNTGDTPLTLGSLTDSVNGAPADSLLAGCGLTQHVLAVGGTARCTYTMTAGTADITNVATVVGRDTLGRDVTDDDDAVVDVINPRIGITKTAAPTLVRVGDTVTYTLVITNSGDAPLTITSLTDVVNGTGVALPAACTGLVDAVPLGPGATRSCSYTMVAGTADVTNVATVVGTDQLGRPVTDDDAKVVDVIHPAIAVNKIPGVATAGPGDTVTYTYVVTNPGDDPLSAVVITDDKCSPLVFVGGDANRDARLDTTETWTFTCSVVVGPASGPLTNVADVTGRPTVGPAVVARDTETVAVERVVTEVAGITISRPPAPPVAPGAAPATAPAAAPAVAGVAAERVARTGASTGLPVKVALVLLVLGGLALLPDHQRRRRGRCISIQQRLTGF